MSFGKKKKIVRLFTATILAALFVAFLGGATNVSAATDAPGKAAISKITTSSGNPKVTWKKVSGATGYRLYRKTSTDEKYVKVADTTKLSYTDKKWKAEDGTTISYKVRAYVTDTDGKTKVWGAYSSARKWTTPKKESETQYPIPVDEKHFPDANFRKYVTDEFGEELTEKEALSCSEIDVSEKEISSLKGIEYFTKLTRLWCSANELTSLDVSKNTELEELICGSNPLKSLDVSKNKKLFRLYCYNNELTSLDVTKNTELLELECEENQLTSLDLTKNTELRILFCSSNLLTSLDLSKNAGMEELRCSSNLLTSLDVSGCTILTDLSCSENRLTELDVTKNTKLYALYCTSNQLTSLDVSKNTYLWNPGVDDGVQVYY